MRRFLAIPILLAISLLTPAAATGETAPELYQRSYEREALDDAAGALDYLERLPASARQGYVYLYRRAWLLYSLGRHEESSAAYAQAATAAPASVEAPVAMLLPQMALRRWKDAEATARAVLERDPRNALARRRLAWTLYNLGRYREAATLYQEVLSEYPSDVEMGAGLGWALLKAGDRARARAAFSAVLAVAPRSSVALDGQRAAGQ